MNDDKLQPIEGEIVEKAEAMGRELETDIREAAKRGGVFIGTLNIMTAPARNFLTDPLLDAYKDHYEGKFKRPKHVFALDAALIALGVIAAATAIYFGLIYKPFDPLPVKLTITPAQPVSGAEVVLNLTVTNLGKDAIDNVTGTLKLPPQLKFKRASLPYKTATGAIDFGSLDAGSEITEHLVADLAGPIGQNIKAAASVSYEISGTGAKGKKGATAHAKIAGSSIGAEFTLPETAISGQEFSGSIAYYNHGNAATENVVIIPNWPQNFSLTAADPSIKADAWSVGTLAPGSSGKINFRGIFASGDATADFGLETGIKVGAETLSEIQTSKTLNLIDPQISVTLNGDRRANLGDKVSFTATYKNSGDRPITSAAASATAEPGLTITSVDNLSATEIKPGESGSFKINGKIDNKLASDDKHPVNPQLLVRAALAGKIDGEQNISISSSAWTVKIASQLGLTVGARYWSDSGDQLGRGPLPPEVGKTTRYWIFWNVSNTTGAVSNVTITGKLPDNVTYTGKAANPFGDAPLYDPATRTMTWNVNDVPAWPGVKTDAIGAACEVAFTPTADQRNTYAPLMTNQEITGTDAVTGLELRATAPDMNTHLTTDPQAAQTGKIK